MVKGVYLIFNYKYLILNYGIENKFLINLSSYSVVGVYQLKKVAPINKRKEKLKLISMKI
jgi:hypothetical protein